MLSLVWKSTIIETAEVNNLDFILNVISATNHFPIKKRVEIMFSSLLGFLCICCRSQCDFSFLARCQRHLFQFLTPLWTQKEDFYQLK